MKRRLAALLPRKLKTDLQQRTALMRFVLIGLPGASKEKQAAGCRAARSESSVGREVVPASEVGPRQGIVCFKEHVSPEEAVLDRFFETERATAGAA